MNKKIIQFRYYGSKNKNNFPTNIKAGDFGDSEFFREYYPIHYLKVQGPDTIKFQINNSESEIKLGPSGIYTLDLQNFATIESLNFSIPANVTTPVIIDLIYG